jgi:predicted aminopeptidase
MTRALLFLALAPAWSGCFTTSYLLQAAGGQVDLLRRARPISSVLADESVPTERRALLARVAAIKRWGQTRGLAPTKNYTHYADLGRPAAVWVVQGCAPLAFEPRRWHFPIVGSVPYLGFFTEAAAREYAARLAASEPLDVTVRGASAYSTLGWFRDPVLSTMLPEGPLAFPALANVVLHESVHATLYVPSQSAFNESLASAVADGLTWELMVGRSGLHGAETKAWLEAEARADRFGEAMHRAWAELDALYRSDLPDDEKRARKAERLAALSAELGTKRRFNNADLSGLRTYATGRDAFERLRRACGSWPRVLDAVKTLTERDFERPQRQDFDDVLDALRARACPPP